MFQATSLDHFVRGITGFDLFIFSKLVRHEVFFSIICLKFQFIMSPSLTLSDCSESVMSSVENSFMSLQAKKTTKHGKSDINSFFSK